MPFYPLRLPIQKVSYGVVPFPPAGFFPAPHNIFLAFHYTSYSRKNLNLYAFPEGRGFPGPSLAIALILCQNNRIGKNMSDEDAYVWSSDEGDMRKKNKDPGPPPSDGTVRVQRETKGRKGKTVTVVYGLPLPQDDLEELAAELKKRCGTGGSAKNGRIIIQGDQTASLMESLKEKGYTVKRSGG
jgi:translation initiation factor 1